MRPVMLIGREGTEDTSAERHRYRRGMRSAEAGASVGVQGKAWIEMEGPTEGKLWIQNWNLDLYLPQSAWDDEQPLWLAAESEHRLEFPKRPGLFQCHVVWWLYWFLSIGSCHGVHISALPFMKWTYNLMPRQILLVKFYCVSNGGLRILTFRHCMAIR